MPGRAGICILCDPTRLRPYLGPMPHRERWMDRAMQCPPHPRSRKSSITPLQIPRPPTHLWEPGSITRPALWLPTPSPLSALMPGLHGMCGPLPNSRTGLPEATLQPGEEIEGSSYTGHLPTGQRLGPGCWPGLSRDRKHPQRWRSGRAYEGA